MKVSARARSHEDRGGDPLDGLVNLFDLGIVLAVAFLIAAISSVDLEELFTNQEALREAQSAANVTAEEDEIANEVQLAPGERVVGQGEVIGTVYELSDGRTVIVRPEGSEAVPGEGAPVAPGDGTTPPADETTPPEEATPPDDAGVPPPDGSTPPDS